MQYINFGKFIKSKRLAISPKISLNCFAIDNDIDPATLSRIENQKQGINLKTIGCLAKGFKTTGSELIKEYESKYKE